MALRRLPVLFLANAILLSSAVTATSAPFDVYYRPSDKGNWILYGGRESRAAADAAAGDLATSSGFETKVFAQGEPVGRPAVGPRVAESIAVGGATYLRRPGLGYAPGWHRYGGTWGGWNGLGGWGGGGWGGGYGGYSGSSSHHHHSSHHHSHEHHSSHHSGNHATAHPAGSRSHSRAGARGGATSHHASSHHHSHSHSHSHSHHSHGGHHR
jgi:hypothetical protein